MEAGLLATPEILRWVVQSAGFVSFTLLLNICRSRLPLQIHTFIRSLISSDNDTRITSDQLGDH